MQHLGRTRPAGDNDQCFGVLAREHSLLSCLWNSTGRRREIRQGSLQLLSWHYREYSTFPEH